ncbi:hypothetical protein GobsT_05270 [Gemmata obscuriglobus]|uniref:Uncharacterized protein n=1 Tax=Gemmata obscuriglobus TaxID=114 RepID=A0A2Z3H5B3_9BACT|nr:MULTISPECIES: hypothetical protein [Gemmata]AWM40908.1 hypothetical protein C1280_30565 [Gemmata obscuriglobus]MDY3554338.1 hypothetical protein [Gemmata algarum]QEG25792.1 hypothetical protein GobsT_05270 [Gemmata obscuriglobus]VTR99655.1 unnamed protein product [Gemmata obscuriglobus UQM 2246]
MNRLQPHEVTKFLRSHRFVGGQLRAVRIVHGRGREVAVEFRVRVRESITDLGAEPKHVSLIIRVSGADEFRFQMRPQQPKLKITDARIGYHNGLFYVTFDSIGLEAGETAQVFDFRSSEVYAAGRELFWKRVEPQKQAE